MGPSQKPYYLHEDVLTSKSHYFRARADFYRKSGATSQNGVDLESAEIQVFDMLVQYLYTRKYDLPTRNGDTNICDLLTNLYLLADYLGIDLLKAATVERMSTVLKGREPGFHKFSPSADEIVRLLHAIYEGTGAKGSSIYPTNDSTSDFQAGCQLPEHHENAAKSEPKQPGKFIKDLPTNGKEALAKDPMRDLICKYAASKLWTLNRDPVFRNMIAEGGTIAVDLVSAMSPASF